MTYPIILAHGVCRFDVLWNKALEADNSDNENLDNMHYFKGVRTMLRKKGYSVFHSNVSWGASVEQRADDLKRNVLDILRKTQADKVNIIAHSMGGLDVRHMLFKDRNHGRIQERIASLTTISTPHNGSPFADWGLKHLSHLISIARKIGLDISAMKDLRTTSCIAYNNDPDVIAFEAQCEKSILFQTYAGKQDFPGVFGALKLPYYIIEKEEGENDGLVSVESAGWREGYLKGVLDRTDHLNELGWWDEDQILAGELPHMLLQRIHAFYAEVAESLP